jgi:sarcosine oxidase delta subunit
LRNVGAEGRKMLKRKKEERTWAKFIWLRTGTSGLLWKRWRNIHISENIRNFLTSWQNVRFTFWRKTVIHGAS